MNYHIAVFFLVVFIQGSYNADLYYIGTSRGTITVTPSGLREMPLVANGEDTKQMFKIDFDSYISAWMDGGSGVWDITGGSYTAGTRIGLYTKKNTSVENQQWILTPGYNKIASKHVPNMVANVTSDGYLTLAPATSVPSLSAFQRMYLVSWYDKILSDLFFENYMNSTVTIYATSLVGPWNLSVPPVTTTSELISPGIVQRTCIVGTELTFVDAAGNTIPPTPYTIPPQSYDVRIPLVSLPATPSTWSGSYRVNKTLNVTISINVPSFKWSRSGGNDHYTGTYNGTGSDTVYGLFDIYFGFFNAGGGINFANLYRSGIANASTFDGSLNGPSTAMVGSYAYDYGHVSGSAPLTLYKIN